MAFSGLTALDFLLSCEAGLAKLGKSEAEVAEIIGRGHSEKYHWSYDLEDQCTVKLPTSHLALRGQLQIMSAMSHNCDGPLST